MGMMAFKHSYMKILNSLQVDGKIERGLCFLCDEPFTIEHQLVHKNINIFMMDIEDEEEPQRCLLSTNT